MANTVHGLYWETRWFKSYEAADWDHDRPCRDGLGNYFAVRSNLRFKVCFARLTIPPLPGAFTSYYHSAHDLRAEPLKVLQTPFWAPLRTHGFELHDLVQWWVEYEELT